MCDLSIVFYKNVFLLFPNTDHLDMIWQAFTLPLFHTLKLQDFAEYSNNISTCLSLLGDEAWYIFKFDIISGGH